MQHYDDFVSCECRWLALLSTPALTLSGMKRFVTQYSETLDDV